MKTLNAIILLIVLGFTISCSNSRQTEKEDTQTDVVDKHESDAEKTTSNLNLVLNDGAKWKSDETTFAGMKRLQLSLYNFNQKTPKPGLVDYNKLGVVLASINNDIIRQCTMQGKDHEQLHILLAPMIDNVDIIKNGKSEIETKENVARLESAVSEFFTYFEVK